jgi:hypothetical protein
MPTPRKKRAGAPKLKTAHAATRKTAKSSRRTKAADQLSGTALWRRLNAINQQLKALGIEWDLSAHTICIYLEDYHGNNDGVSVSHSMPLAKGWSAEFVVSNDGGRVMVGAEEVALGLDDLLRLIVSKRFRLKTIGWTHLCQFDHNRGNETGWRVGPSNHDYTRVDESTIRITSPTGREVTFEGGIDEPHASCPCCGADLEVSCDISFDVESPAEEPFAGELTVDLSVGAESLSGSFPFEVPIDVWCVKPSNIYDPEESVLTTDLEPTLRAVILEGEALLAAKVVQ